MRLKGLEIENFNNYKEPAMFLAFPTCTFKCDKEAGCSICQNSQLAHAPDVEISLNTIVDLYMKTPYTSAIVCGGLEPFDSPDSLLCLVMTLRYYTPDPIIIYTGYTEKEVEEKDIFSHLKIYENIIIKYGRFIPNQPKIFDNVLGIELASNNQYAKYISDEINVRSEKAL